MIVASDARRIPLADESVQCVVTSPPYWGLRKYAGNQDLIWGGDADCAHEWASETRIGDKREGGCSSTWASGTGAASTFAKGGLSATTNTCIHCGAWRGAYGLEPQVEMYVAHSVEILREIRRVLRKDGVVFWNVGDSYANDGKWGGSTGGKHVFALHGNAGGLGREKRFSGLKPKDLCLIPARVALAAQVDGWWVRSLIIWAKPNPMPESVTDRPTDAYEHIIMLVKGQWKSRVVKASDLHGERVHLGKHIGFQSPSTNSIAFCVDLARALFDGYQAQNNFSLPPFYSQEWKQCSNGSSSEAITGRPVLHRLAALSARFISADVTAEEFVGEFNRIWLALPKTDQGLVGAVATQFFSPSIYCDRDGAIAINHSGKIGKFGVSHEGIVIQEPTTCNYYWDAEAVKEPVTGGTHSRGTKLSPPSETTSEQHIPANGRRAHAGWSAATSEIMSSRNLRNVWTFPTQPYSGAHFATFPEEIPRRCILAATSSRGGCAQCGAPWERLTERDIPPDSLKTKHNGPDDGMVMGFGSTGARYGTGQKMQDWLDAHPARTVGWKPTCKCGTEETISQLVFDPFGGSGTTDAVAIELRRRCVLLDLAYTHDYRELAESRTRNVQMEAFA